MSIKLSSCQHVPYYNSQFEKLRNDKEKENQMIEQKYEQAMKAMREEMENKFQQILVKVDVANLR